MIWKAMDATESQGGPGKDREGQGRPGKAREASKGKGRPGEAREGGDLIKSLWALSCTWHPYIRILDPV